jgi:transposase InsO family protein
MFRVTVRTICRWKKAAKAATHSSAPTVRIKRKRKRRHPPEVFARAIELKKELPRRSAAGIHRLLKMEFPRGVPCESTIRKFLAANGLSSKGDAPRKGYKRFTRGHANDLWQVDIAGPQKFGHLGVLYLHALLDDHSRFVPAGKYFRDTEGPNVFAICRDAFLGYGRPGQVLADNGSQFRNVHGDHWGKFEEFLHLLDVEPIYSRPGHPQTKGKIERWFRTVAEMFVPEAQLAVERNPDMTLPELNQMFQEWLAWYNSEKSHKELPHRHPPAKSFYGDAGRVYRPLQGAVDWERWVTKVQTRRVRKTNEVAYKTKMYSVPEGYMGCTVETREADGRLNIFYNDALLASHALEPVVVAPVPGPVTRRVSSNSTIGYGSGHPYVGQKYAGSTVEAWEANEGRTLLVYLDGVLVKEVPLD